MGSGKSTACNFFLRKKIFDAGIDFNRVTRVTQFSVGMIKGKLTKFVDTAGLLDPYDNSKIEFRRIAEAILDVPNGIHALGIVIKIGDRLSAKEVKAIAQILLFVELIPFTFVIFSNANSLNAKTAEDQQHVLKSMINRAHKILPELLKKIENRYIILESVLLNEDEGYYTTKVDELMGIVDSITDKQKGPFTCFLNEIAKKLLESDASPEECIYALMTDLQRAREESEKNARAFWESVFTMIGAGAGAGAGVVIGAIAGPPGGAAAGAMGASLGASAVATILGTGVLGGVGGGSLGYGAKKCLTQ